MNFASDNTGPVHPRVMAALAAANEGYAPPYGDDETTLRVRDRVREIFEAPEAEVFLVATGSAANALSLATIVRPWEAIYCSAFAHIHMDECGAPEFYSGGSKLVLVPGKDAMITPDALAAAISEGFERGLHYVQPGALSVTQLTERGTAYGVDDLRALTSVARAHGLGVHMDGARFANALLACSTSPGNMSWDAGIDILSFGGTKNGLMGVEAVVAFDPAQAEELTYRRKRGAHLFSKHRFLAAQMDAYLEDGLWLEMARDANRTGQRLAAGLSALPHAELQFPAAANMIYVSLPRSAHRRAVAAGADYFLTLDELAGGSDTDQIVVRLVTNWATTDEEVDRFLELVS